MKRKDHPDQTAQEPFLTVEEDESYYTKQTRQTCNGKLILLHLSIAIAYALGITVLLWKATSRSETSQDDLQFYSPAKEALSYNLHLMHMDPQGFMADNPFVGDPREDLDEAWDNLLRNIQISVDPSEFSHLQPQINRSSLRLPNGSYIIRLRVYHDLHCLKWIRKWMHRDHYWPNISGYELYERRWHIEHCLEGFRLNAMCKPSLAPSTFYFADKNKNDEIMADGSHIEKCANWDVLQEWASERRVDLNDVDRSSLLDIDT